MTTKKKGATTARRAAPAVAPPAPVAAPDEYMSIESACKLLGKWRAHVKDRLLDGTLSYRIIEGRHFLTRASVEAYAAALVEPT